MTDVRITEVDSGSASTFRFEATCDGALCGRIAAAKHRGKISGLTAWVVTNIRVWDEFQRRYDGTGPRVGTKLYEAAAVEACRRRGHLASTSTGRIIGAHSNEFWQKQLAKGRAVAGRRTKRSDGGATAAYVLPDCPPPSLAGAKRRR